MFDTSQPWTFLGAGDESCLGKGFALRTLKTLESKP